MKIRLMVCLAFVSGSTMAQVYKCTVDGRTVYADQPCGQQTQKVRVYTPPAESLAILPDASVKQGLDEVTNRLNIRAAIASGQPMVSMNSDELFAAMGKPDQISTSDDGKGVEERLIYNRRGRTIYVYTKNAMVTSIQTTAASAPKAKKPCPTNIRDMEIEAGSLRTRGTEHEKVLRRKILEAQECR